ncbi:MAG: nucleotidyltransferase family protein [Bacteroidales bacterium]|nr:nucleotidyltransferase family protein [Bacteroidales bacterium]
MARTRDTGISPVQKEYLDILRSAIWGEKPSHIPEDVEGVLEIANLQKTRPLVLDALQKAGYEVTDPHDWDVIYRTTSAHISIDRTIGQLVSLFRGNGINPVLLKGQGIALNYPEPMLRECGDIDMYVGEEMYDKACALIDAQESVSKLEEESFTDKHYQVRMNGVYVEIHRAAEIIKDKKQNEYYQNLSRTGLSRDLIPITISGQSIDTPADSFNAFYLFHHFVIHSIFGGVGLRQICDWVLFLHSRAGKLDLSVTDNALTFFKLRDVWRLYASIAVDYLGLPAGEMPFYESGLNKRSSELLSLILEEGNFGYNFNLLEGRPSSMVSGKLYTMRILNKRYLKLYHLYPEMKSLIFRKHMEFLLGGIGRITKE